MGRDHSYSFHPHIYSIHSYVVHHPIIPSFHHLIILILLYRFLIIPLYTITDLSFGVVPGGNPALSPILLVDAGSTSKRSNSELSSGAVCEKPYLFLFVSK